MGNCVFTLIDCSFRPHTLRIQFVDACEALGVVLYIWRTIAKLWLGGGWAVFMLVLSVAAGSRL